MEQEDTFQRLFREILEPIIDDCVTRALNKYINELKFDHPESNDVLDVGGAMNYLKISKPTIYKLTMERQIPHYKIGKRLYFRKEEIDEWINKGKVLTQEEIDAEADAYLSRRGRKY